MWLAYTNAMYVQLVVEVDIISVNNQFQTNIEAVKKGQCEIELFMKYLLYTGLPSLMAASLLVKQFGIMDVFLKDIGESQLIAYI